VVRKLKRPTLNTNRKSVRRNSRRRRKRLTMKNMRIKSGWHMWSLNMKMNLQEALYTER